MLEQKDFVNAEFDSKKALRAIKFKFKKGEISSEEARYQARVELLNLKHKFPILEFILSAEDMKNIRKLVKSYENFIESTKSIDFNI